MKIVAVKGIVLAMWLGVIANPAGANASVPKLIRLSWSRGAFVVGLSFRVYLASPSIAALVRIGHPGVPQIVSAIEVAETAASLAFPPKGLDGIKTREELANKIRSTVANVLSQIGDVRALPVLESLLEKSDDGEVRSRCREAIALISHKSGSTC